MDNNSDNNSQTKFIRAIQRINVGQSFQIAQFEICAATQIRNRDIMRYDYGFGFLRKYTHELGSQLGKKFTIIRMLGYKSPIFKITRIE